MRKKPIAEGVRFNNSLGVHVDSVEISSFTPNHHDRDNYYKGDECIEPDGEIPIVSKNVGDYGAHTINR